jgi:hypothetical protein
MQQWQHSYQIARVLGAAAAYCVDEVVFQQHLQVALEAGVRDGGAVRVAGLIHVLTDQVAVLEGLHQHIR